MLGQEKTHKTTIMKLVVAQMKILLDIIKNKLKGSVLSEPLFFCLDKKYFICYNIIVNKERDIKSQNKKIILTK